MSKFSGWLVFAGLLAGPMAQACVALPTELAGLPLVRVIIAPTGGREQVIDAYLAQSPPARAQGFQNVCAEQIQIMAILFVFDSSGRRPFHMRNVSAPLDILFAGDEGEVLDVQVMEVYSDDQPVRLYTTPQAYRYALETTTGRLLPLFSNGISGQLRIDGMVGE